MKSATPRRRSRPAAEAPPPNGGQPGAARLAAIDIGSNSIRQLVADVSAGGIVRVVDEMKSAPRLGSGVAATGELGPTAMMYAIDSLSRMATLARQLGAERIEAVATSAVREAANGDHFLTLVRRATGLAVRVLDGEEEARLAFRSALANFELGNGRAAVMDIGGGSLELALSADGLLDRLVSLPLGALRMSETFARKRDHRINVARVRRAVREAMHGRVAVREWRGAQVIGSGGTLTNLAGMYLGRQGLLPAPSVHGTRIPRTDVEHILDTLQGMTPEERLAVPGLNAGRADIIVGGVAVAAEVLARLEARELVVSRYGIREGLLLEMGDVRPIVADPGEARERSVREFAERCRYERLHAEHVRGLALQLFDALGDRLRLTRDDRQLLADAALLHDVGYHINYQRHHKHSYHLIRHADLLGMSPSEQVLVANVARYHRGRAPRKTHPEFGPLDKKLRRRIRRLAALLRVADGFDRGHVGAVAKLKVRWMHRALRITPVPARRGLAMRLELWGASRKCALLAKVAGVPVEVVAPGGGVVRPDAPPGIGV